MILIKSQGPVRPTERIKDNKLNLTVALLLEIFLICTTSAGNYFIQMTIVCRQIDSFANSKDY